LAAPTPALPNKFVAERNDFLEMGINRFPAVVVQVAMKFPDAAIDLQFIVRIGPAPPGAAALPEPRLPVRVPISVPNPASAVPAKAGKTERGKARELGSVRKNAGDFFAQRGGNRFIGIEPENPFAACFCGRGVLLGNVSLPGFAENFRPILAGDFLGIIADLLVKNYDGFTGPARDAVQGAANPRRLRAGNHAYRDRQSDHLGRR